MNNMKRKLLLAANLAIILVLVFATGAFASDVDVAVVDVTAPIDSVTVDAGSSGPITINLSVTGKQEGTATFEVYRNWTLSGGIFTGSNPQEFSVPPRAAGAAATTFTTSGTVTVAPGESEGTTVTLTVGVFDITNSNATGAKLDAGDPGVYSVTVTEPPAPSDTTAPVLSLPGSITAEATGPSGAVVSYTATATDVVDGALTPDCTPASGITFGFGTTEVNCTASDAAGNVASGSFMVTVVDTTPPVIAAHDNETAEATSAAGAIVSYDSPATSDLVSGAGVADCLPASGSQFALGDTNVICSATDAAGNSASSSFTVTVVDTTAPVLTLPGPITAEATGPSGAAVTYTASANDAVDGSVSISCNSASGSTFPLGPTTVNCSATDAAGNSAIGSFTVSVVDTIAPVLTLPASFTVEATGPSGAVVTYAASAEDLVNGSVSVTCSPASGGTFPLGPTTVSCLAADAAGNSASGSFTVSVQYNWSGFFRPVDNLPTLNSVKAGSAVPVKFSLNGDMGLSIFAAGYPTSGSITCASSEVIDPIEETVTAGNSSLSYDPVANQYVYVWKTDKSWAGTCRQLVVKLIDGTFHRANFKLTK